MPGTFIELTPLRFVPIEGYDPTVTHPSASLAGQLAATYRAGGLEAAIAEYRNLRARFDLDGEVEINALGYELLRGGHAQDAIAVLQMNVEDHPESWNAYDSLAEALKEAGDRQRAIELYEKSLRLNPDNANAVRMLEELDNQASAKP